MEVEFVTSVKLEENSIIVIKGEYDRLQKRAIAEKLRSMELPKNTTICLLDEESSIESIDEMQMNEKGWYRK